MPKVLLSVQHQLQRSDGDCLAACVAMVLEHLGYPIDYSELLELLKFKTHGAPASNVRFLETLDLTVAYSQTGLAGLKSMLQEGYPLIVFVRTGQLPYWTYNTDHALLVVGSDSKLLYVHDPSYSQAPIGVPLGDFELAWLERDYYYALIKHA